MKAQRPRAALILLVVSGWSAADCRPAPSTSGDANVARDQKALASIDAKRQARVQELKGMDVRRLAQELWADSRKGVEPFNSAAYRELVSRGERVAAEVKATLQTADASSLLVLLALRNMSTAQYQAVDQGFRVRVLVDALKNARFFNMWGIPHLFWEDAAKAVIAEGKAAEAPLLALLGDKREARLWGSEGNVEQQRYRYRVCDYAWALLNEVRGTRISIPEDPVARDRLIEVVRQASAGKG